jgi:hypothetical protein
MRGPAIFPGQLGQSELPTTSQRFDALLVGLVARIESRWGDHLGLVEYAVEDTPQMPDDWDGPAPLASLVRGSGGQAAKLVVFRRPLELRAQGRAELTALMAHVLAEQIAELLGVLPQDVDPEY